MAMLPKAIYRFNAILIKIPAASSVESDKLILEFMWKWKTPRTDKRSLKKNYKVGGLILPHFKTYYKLQLSRLCGPGTGTDIQMKKTELRVQENNLYICDH